MIGLRWSFSTIATGPRFVLLFVPAEKGNRRRTDTSEPQAASGYGYGRSYGDREGQEGPWDQTYTTPGGSDSSKIFMRDMQTIRCWIVLQMKNTIGTCWNSETLIEYDQCIGELFKFQIRFLDAWQKPWFFSGQQWTGATSEPGIGATQNSAWAAAITWGFGATFMVTKVGALLSLVSIRSH